jgi:type IV secretion system protein VirB9
LRKQFIENEAAEAAGSVTPEPVPPVIYREQPVYVPAEAPETPGTLTGKEAVTEFQKDITQTPEYRDGRIQWYSFDDEYIYEIYCQPYRTTDIELEPGEEVLETPIISEPDVWQLAAGEGVKNGLPVMHFFVKPDQSRLTTSFIIITNRRVYHTVLKSHPDYYMPIVRWKYPGDRIQNLERQLERLAVEKSEQVRRETRETYENYSFNYKIQVGLFTKVLWVPKQIYDDGMRTYIVLDETTLHQELPALFNEKKEIVNYRVDKNVLIVDALIKKMTLRLGKDKVTLKKKK